jgi:hypothetical protein
MASYTSSAGTHSNDASKFCDICQRDASATHYSSPAHLLTLTNFATRLAHTTSTTRTNILQVAKSCKGMTKKLERIKPAMQQERHRQ